MLIVVLQINADFTLPAQAEHHGVNAFRRVDKRARHFVKRPKQLLLDHVQHGTSAVRDALNFRFVRVAERNRGGRNDRGRGNIAHRASVRLDV